MYLLNAGFVCRARHEQMNAKTGGTKKKHMFLSRSLPYEPFRITWFQKSIYIENDFKLFSVNEKTKKKKLES